MTALRFAARRTRSMRLLLAAPALLALASGCATSGRPSFGAVGWAAVRIAKQVCRLVDRLPDPPENPPAGGATSGGEAGGSANTGAAPAPTAPKR